MDTTTQALATALAQEWAATLLDHVPAILRAAYESCGLQCVAAQANALQLPAPLIDILLALPAGTTATAMQAAGLVIRGM